MTVQIIRYIPSNHNSINSLSSNHPSQIINNRRHGWSCYYTPISKSNHLYLSLFQCWISKHNINPSKFMWGWEGLLICSPSECDIAEGLFERNISKRTLMDICRIVICEWWCCCLYILARYSSEPIAGNNIYEWILAWLLSIEIDCESISRIGIDEYISIVYPQSKWLARSQWWYWYSEYEKKWYQLNHRYDLRLINNLLQ